MTGDQGLIQKAAAGDEEAFSELYLSYRDWAYRLAWRFLKDEGLAQDVVQETFVYLIKKLPTLELTACLTTFLYPVVKNLCLNQLRARRPRPGRTAAPRSPRAGTFLALTAGRSAERFGGTAYRAGRGLDDAFH